MNEKINIVEILKDCPKGTKLYSPLCGECRVIKIYDSLGFDVINGTDDVFNFSYDGRYNLMGECCIFPSKDQKDWSKFQKPFKDGDILVYTGCYKNIFIYRNKENEPNYSTSFYVACNDSPIHNFLIYNKYTLIALNENSDVRFATEEEKQKLFDAIKANGYKWNTETKTLEKLVEPKFKVGDEIVKKNGISNSFIVQSVNDEYYGLQLPDKSGVGVLPTKDQGDWMVISSKPKFKVGDKIRHKETVLSIVNVGENKYVVEDTPKNYGLLTFSTQDVWELVFEPKFKVGDEVYNKKTDMVGTISKIYDDEKEYMVNLKKGGITYICFEHENCWELVSDKVEPKFKAGDSIRKKGSYIAGTVVEIDKDYFYKVEYNEGSVSYVNIKSQNDWELVPDKFDISTLKRFESRVLVRNYESDYWKPAIFGFVEKNKNTSFYVEGGNFYNKCIPFEGNEHLLGTTDDCDEYYKIGNCN